MKIVIIYSSCSNMSFFLLLNTQKKYILKNMCNQTVDGPIDFHSIGKGPHQLSIFIYVQKKK